MKIEKTAQTDDDELARTADIYRRAGEYVCLPCIDYARQLIAMMKCKLSSIVLGDAGQPILTYALTVTRNLIIDVWANGRLTWAISGNRVLRRGAARMTMNNVPDEVGKNCGCA